MKFIKIVSFFVVIIFLIPARSIAVTRIICTTALAQSHYEFRKQQYITAFEKLHELGIYDFYIVEAIKKNSPTFLDDYSKNVFYATVNNPSLINHGINEARTLLEGCEHFNFDPEDMVIKLTGRHSLTSNFLINIVESNPAVDAFVKRNIYQEGFVYTIAFAMRYKYLKEMLTTIDYSIMNKPLIPLEAPVDAYIKRKSREGNFSVCYLNRLDVVANIFGSTTAPGAPMHTIVF